MTNNKIHIIFSTASFFILCSIALFATSGFFVNREVMPKWYWGLLCSMFLLLTGLTLSFFSKTKSSQRKEIIPYFCLIISGLCTLQALYGISQYIGFFPPLAGFRITGSFDNPAGFAACLCAGFPFAFYFIRKQYAWQRWFSLAAVAVVCVAVVLSAGCLLSIAVFSLFSYPLTYPFVWIMGIISIIVIIYKANYSIFHYIRASNMYPVKFMPLYQLAELYDETEHKEEALSLARKIIDKEVKIPPSTVSVIKQKMQQLIEKSKAEKETKSVPASESRTSIEPINKIQPSQENLSEKQTPKELQPP